MKMSQIKISIALFLIFFLITGCETTKYVPIEVEDDFDYSNFHYSREPQFEAEHYDIDGEKIDEVIDENQETELYFFGEPDFLHTEATLRALYKARVLAHQQGLDPHSIVATENSEAQILKYATTLSSKNWNILTYGNVKPKRSDATVQVLFYVWAFYSFTDNRDYYVVEQEVSITNQILWDPNTHKSVDNNGDYWFSVEYFLSQLKVDNVLKTNATNYPPVNPNRMLITQTEPKAVNNQSNYSTQFSFNLGGNVGSVKNVTSGVSMNVGKSYTILDFSVVANSMSSGYNTSWIWNCNKMPTKKTLKTNLTAPADLAIQYAVFGCSWVWGVDNPGTDEVFRLGLILSGEHASSGYGYSAQVKHKKFPWEFTGPDFLLNPPIRIQ